MENETDAQKKDAENPEEPLEDMTPEKDAMGGAVNPMIDAQKKEIDDL